MNKSPYQQAIDNLNRKNQLNLQRAQVQSSKQIAENVQSLAQSAKDQAEQAEKSAKHAAFRSWVAIIISVLALIFEIYRQFS